jgi:hypothetical protein
MTYWHLGVNHVCVNKASEHHDTAMIIGNFTDDKNGNRVKVMNRRMNPMAKQTWVVIR